MGPGFCVCAWLSSGLRVHLHNLSLMALINHFYMFNHHIEYHR
jgi:hypothetical protein